MSLQNSGVWVILVNLESRWLRTEHTTTNRCQFDVGITSIRRREDMDNFSHHFDVLFQCNFDEQKFDVVLTYFLLSNFDERKIDVVSTCFVQGNFDEQNIDVVSMYFFRLDFDGRKINVVSVYFLVQFRWKSDVTAHVLMWFRNLEIVIVLIFLFDKFLMYWKLKLFEWCLIRFWISLW